MEKDKQNDIYLLQCNLLDIQFKAELRKEETLFFLCALLSCKCTRLHLILDSRMFKSYIDIYFKMYTHLLDNFVISSL